MSNTTFSQITIYTDGSCNTQSLTGAWAAIILAAADKVILSELEQNTTHNRMELTAVIRAIAYAVHHYPGVQLHVFTDSQYVVNLTGRKERLKSANFITKKGAVLNNADLLQHLIFYIENYPIVFVKVKAHQKASEAENINREVDMICRKIMREG